MFVSSPFLRVGPRISWECVTEVSNGYPAWRYAQLTSYYSGVLTKLSLLSLVRIKFISPTQIYKNWATKFSVHITTTDYRYRLQTWCLIQNPLHTICGKTSIFLTVEAEPCTSYCSSTLCYLFSNVLIHTEGLPLPSLQEWADTQQDVIPHPQRYHGSRSQAVFHSSHCSPSSMQIRLQLYKLLRVRLLYSFFKQDHKDHKLLHLLFPLFSFLMLKGWQLHAKEIGLRWNYDKVSERTCQLFGGDSLQACL